MRGTLLIAAISACWTVLIMLGTYMSPTGVIGYRDLLPAVVPVLISVGVSMRFASKGRRKWPSVVAAVVALLPFALFSMVAIQQGQFIYYP